MTFILQLSSVSIVIYFFNGSLYSIVLTSVQPISMDKADILYYFNITSEIFFSTKSEIRFYIGGVFFRGQFQLKFL